MIIISAVHRSNHALVAAHVPEATSFNALHAVTSTVVMDAEDV